MTPLVDILIIDDDRLSQKLILKALAQGGLAARVAGDGSAGLAEAQRQCPDIVLLDVEMPGMNGYTVCDQLRADATTRDAAIIFLSGRGSLRERMQGYEVGADDYLVKPFEAEHLLARIKVLIKYREERGELKSQYELACKTAMTAMTGSSELGQAIQFMERSFGYSDVHQLAQGLFEATDRLSLECCLMVMMDDETHWYASDGSISPLEKELLEMNERQVRFMDFGLRTIVNFPELSLLVKNMPVHDMERYGRIKDLLPVLLSATQAKIASLKIQDALRKQSGEVLSTFGSMRGSLYRLAKTLVRNRDHCDQLMRQTVIDISDILLRMGLEEDQEQFLLNRVETTIDEVAERMNAGAHIRSAFTSVLASMQHVVDKQQTLAEAFNTKVALETATPVDAGGEIELF